MVKLIITIKEKRACKLGSISPTARTILTNTTVYRSRVKQQKSLQINESAKQGKI
jgi:hypothetical protein